MWGERCGYTGGSLFGDAPYMGKKKKTSYGAQRQPFMGTVQTMMHGFPCPSARPSVHPPGRTEELRATHGCRVVRAKAGACCRILPARGLWRALPVVPPCRAPASRAAYFIDISFFVRRVPSKAMPVTGFGNTTKKRAAFCRSVLSRNKTNPALPFS